MELNSFQKKLLEEKKQLELRKQELMIKEAEFKGKEKRLLLLEEQLLNTTNEISKLSQDKEEILQDIQYLKDIAKFFDESKTYSSILVNIVHNPCYYKYFTSKGLTPEIKDVLSVIYQSIELLNYKFSDHLIVKESRD